MADYLLRADHVSKTYPDGDVHALNDVTFAVREGEYVAIMGPSGSGKSTLLNLLGALDTPTSGEVFFEDEPLSKMATLDRIRAEKIGYVFQSFHLLPTLNALENVQLPMFELRLSPRDRVQRARSLLEQVRIGHRATHLPTRLSVGERQRVAIARSLANNPVVLLADEPTGNLDTRTGEEILALFAELHEQRNMTLVVITHSPEVAERAERVVHMRDGRIVKEQVRQA